MRKKLIFIFALIFCLMPVLSVNAEEASWQTCDVYDGDNVNNQNYSRWSKPIYSYLTPCDDGKIIRVQANTDAGGILVEYYDQNYNLLESKIVADELPIFGGFYATDSNYFLLTGQKNTEESDAVEVFRITKYDKEWKRIASAGLSACNTTYPFDAGSARMDVCGKYLLIRTSHEMYKSNDGYNHQANVMIELDMENMKITDSCTNVVNSGYGYVSHSFNQFIKMDGNNIVSVDHGDAYPRSIVLLKYQTDASTGQFTPNYYNKCAITNIMEFPGNIGDNTTEASVGGFEISESSYLVAGNSIIQDGNSHSTRNIFVAASDKTTREVKITWLTNYADGDGTTSTPHMVKVNDDQFIILWYRNNKVYYTTLDVNGEITSRIFEMSGSLSDCVPIIMNDRLIWYVWNDENIMFYEINLSDLSENTKKEFKNGHKYVNAGTKDGQAKLQCTHCKNTTSVIAATSMRVYWNDWDNLDYYYDWSNDNRKKVGDKFCYLVTGFSPRGADETVEVIVEDPEILSCEDNGLSGVFTAQKAGKTNVTFQSVSNLDLKKTFTIYIDGDLQIDSFTADKESPIRKGKTITLNAEAVGGSWEYSYKFYYLEHGQETVIQDYSKKSSCTWVPDTAGTKTLYVAVKDSKKNVDTKSLNLEILENGLTENMFDFTPQTDLVYDGQVKSVSVSGKPDLGIGNVTVKYYDAEGKRTTSINAGIYTVKVDIADSAEYGPEKDLTFPSWNFEIQKAVCAPNVPESTLQTSHGYGKVGNIKGLPKDWTWEERETILPVNGTVTAMAKYCGLGAGNYQKETQEIVISTDDHSGGEAFCERGAICEACGKEYTDINPGHHDFQKATCVRRITCSVCGVEEGEIDPSNHVGKVVKNKKAASYLATGYTGDVVCEGCNLVFTKGSVTKQLVLGKPGSFKISSSKKAMTLRFTKAKNATGTQVQYSKYASMKGAKGKKTTRSVVKVSKLTSKKTYYVRIRAYKKIGSKTVYSGWSTVKKMKIK